MSLCDISVKYYVICYEVHFNPTGTAGNLSSIALDGSSNSIKYGV